MNVLQEADALVNGDRQRDYGHPKANAAHIAGFWNNYLLQKLTGLGIVLPVAALAKLVEGDDIGPMMILLKVAREQFSSKRDNSTDIAGYAKFHAVVKGYDEMIIDEQEGIYDVAQKRIDDMRKVDP